METTVSITNSLSELYITYTRTGNNHVKVSILLYVVHSELINQLRRKIDLIAKRDQSLPYHKIEFTFNTNAIRNTIYQKRLNPSGWRL